MKRLAIGWRIAAALPALALLLAWRPADGPKYEDLATSAVSDLQAKVSVVQSNEAELKKISRDFGFAYKIRSLTLRYKAPDKLRLEGKLAAAPAAYVVNGSKRLMRVDAIHLTKTDDLGDAAGKRYSLLELGIVTRADLARTHAKYLRDEKLDGVDAHVFEVTYRGDDTLKYVVWMDPRTHVVLKRQWFDSAGALKATFRYEDAKQITDGVWMPTKLEVRNGEGSLAGVTTYDEIKLNQGLADSVFQTS